jgi:putative hydrolase of the HAD superfamily
MATRSSRPPRIWRRSRHACLLLRGLRVTLRKPPEQMQVDRAVGSPRMTFSELPAGHSDALHAHSLRDLQLSEARGKTQPLPHPWGWQDVVKEGLDPLQRVRVRHGTAFHDRWTLERYTIGSIFATAKPRADRVVIMLVLFDLDGTLVDRQAAYGDATAALCRAHNYPLAVERWLLAELAQRANAADFLRLRDTFVVHEDPADLWREYVDRMAAAITCRPGVLEGLPALKTAGWTIGIATNGAADIQRAKLATTGIDALVDGIAVSGDQEIRKPDRRLFELAAVRCGRRLADGGWMVGDNPAADVGGGHQAGLRTIWLRGRPWPDNLAPAHRTVGDVTDAINILLNETE